MKPVEFTKNRSPLEVHYAKTADGIYLALGRYPNYQGPPIILMHGFAQSHKIWDFPILSHNFALYLSSRGYDVWLPCSRGHGDDEIRSLAPRAWNWNIDDLAIHDVAAIISEVHKQTSRKPIWVGHSLGGVLAYMYLQGVCYHPSDYRPSQHIVISDNKLSESRNKELHALVTLASPVVMEWEPFGMKEDLFWRSNLIVPLLTKLKILQNLTNRWERIPTATIMAMLTSDRSTMSVANVLVRKAIRWPIYKIANSYSSALFWYPPNMNEDLIYHLLTNTLNDISNGVLTQFIDWIKHRTLRAYPNGVDPPHIYCDNFTSVHIPTLVITGNRDKLVSPDIVHKQGFEKISSSSKQYQCFENFGHNDLCIGLKAPETIYPFVEQWIQKVL